MVGLDLGMGGRRAHREQEETQQKLDETLPLSGLRPSEQL